MRNRRALGMFRKILPVLGLAGPLWSFAGDAQAAEKQKGPEVKAAPVATVTDIRLSFKVDPRLIDSTYGGERWVSSPTYMGANAQDTVEAQAQGVDGKGTPTKISPQWIPSAPEMVTVSPSQGDRVKITVHHAGESKLKVAAQGFSKELVVKAKYLGKFIQVEITQLGAGKSAGGAAAPHALALKSQAPARDASVFKSQKEKVSYALGMNLGNAARKQSIEVDAALINRGLGDALSGGKTLLSEEEGRATLLELQNELKGKKLAVQRENEKELAENIKKKGEAFLADNKKKKGVVTLPSGLQYKVLKVGHGKRPTDGDIVECHYRATGTDGTELDSSYRRGQPAMLGVAAVIPAWREALKLMPVGSKWQLFLPPQVSYGEQRRPGRKRSGPVRPVVAFNLPLIVELELLAIKRRAPSETAAATAPTRATKN